MNLYLIDGTYELFRAHFGAPKRKTSGGVEVGATLGLLRSLLALLNPAMGNRAPRATHAGVAFDHVIRSFRNDLYPGYKSGEGVDPELLAQFPLAEEAVAALGLVTWPVVEFEADDALATAAARFRDAPGVEQVILCSTDKDLAQCVTGPKVVCWDRGRDITLDEEGVRAKFGVPPVSIPDFLALTGDASDGYPGLPGWGPKSAAAVLSRFGHLEAIPTDPAEWGLPAARAARLAESLFQQRGEAFLYRRLATLREDAPVHESVVDLEWRGALPAFRALCERLETKQVLDRVALWQ